MELKKYIKNYNNMNKVSVKLQGGLCNYLFQIATAYAYAKKTGKECIFTTDDSVVVHKHLDNYKENILSNVEFLKNYNFSGFKTLSESGFNYAEIPNVNNNIYLQGYYQSEKYFKEYLDDIKNMFKFPYYIFEDVAEIALDSYGIEMDIDNTCSIHVRRGDFLNYPNHHPQQGIQYYMKAAKKIGMDKTFLVFSDDIQWCKENFPEMDNFIFIEGLKDYEDLLLMSLCKNNIICNSTFSWWAAWLNNNKEKIIIAPKKWFGSAYENYNIKDLLPNDWIQI